MSYNTTPNRRNHLNLYQEKSSLYSLIEHKTPIQELAHTMEGNINKNNIIDKNESILEAISNQIRYIEEQNRQISQKYELMMNQLEYARPADIKINNDQGNNYSHEVVKKVVQSAISLDINNTNASNASEVNFHKHNIELQKQIEMKMKQIEQIELQIKTCHTKQCSALSQYQKNEEELKNILKSKGSIEDAEQKQKDKKNKVNQIKYIRQLLQNYKVQKISKIQDVIHCLDVLKQCRNERLNKVNEMFQYGEDIGLSNVNTVLAEFITNLQQLKSQKIDLLSWSGEETGRQSHSIKQKILQNLNLNVTPRNSMMGNVNPFNSEKQQKPKSISKNNNKLQTKKTLNNSSMFGQNQLYQNTARYSSNSGTPSKVPATPKNSIIFFQQPEYQSNPQIRLQHIIQQYHQISKQIMRIRQLQSIYFTQKSQRLNQQFRVKALEKYYLVGVLGYEHHSTGELTKYENIINYTVKKCQYYNQYIEEKSKQQSKLSAKIKNVQESIELLNQQIQVISSEPVRKKQAKTQLQYFLSEISQTNKRSSSKQMHSEYQKYKIRKSLLERQLEEYAEQGDLEGYKKIKNKIEQIQFSINLIDKKFKLEDKANSNQGNSYLGGIGSQNGVLLSKVKQILQKNNIQMPLQKILYRNQEQLLTKLTRRLEVV